MFGDSSTSSAWLTTVYTSEICFLFHLPIIFALDPQFMRPESITTKSPYKATTLSERFQMKWQFMKQLFTLFFLREHKERTKFLYRQRTLGLFLPLEITIFLVRGVLNTTAIYYICYNLDAAVDKSTNVIIDSILFTKEARQGWMFFMYSLIPWLISYVIHRYHIAHYHIPIYPTLYRMAHWSPFNFSLDLPGWAISTVRIQHYFIVATNLFLVPYFLYAIYATIPLILAWACYMISYSYFDINGYKFGMCPAIYSSDTARLQPVCTQPYARCGQGITLKRREYDHLWHFVLHCLIILAVVYDTTITPKIQYYQNSLSASMQAKKTN